MAKSIKPGAPAVAADAAPTDPSKPFIPVDVGGKVVNVVVCWSPEKVASYLKRWPDGVVNLAELEAVPADQTMGRGTHQERCWLKARALALAGKAPSMRAFCESLALRMAASPPLQLPARQFRRT